MGAAAKVEHQLLAPLARRGAALTQERLARSQANIATLRAHALHQADPTFVKSAGPEAANDILAPAENTSASGDQAAEDLLSAMSAPEPSE